MRFLQLYLSIQKRIDTDYSYDEKSDQIRNRRVGGAYGTDDLWNECPSYEGPDVYR